LIVVELFVDGSGAGDEAGEDKGVLKEKSDTVSMFMKAE
jgi:hypothetical protein